MANINQNARIQKVITFTPTLYQMADDKAQKMGVSFPEYVRHLLLNSVQTEINNQYLLSEREETSIGRSLNDIKKGDYSVLKTNKDINDFVDNL